MLLRRGLLLGDAVDVAAAQQYLPRRHCHHPAVRERSLQHRQRPAQGGSQQRTRVHGGGHERQRAALLLTLALQPLLRLHCRTVRRRRCRRMPASPRPRCRHRSWHRRPPCARLTHAAWSHAAPARGMGAGRWRRRGLSGGGHACTCAPRTGSGGGSHAHLHPCRLMILHVQRWRQRQLDDLAKGGGAGARQPLLREAPAQR